ncbi:MAG: hypothetical protein ACXVHX_02100 [Solirubrobacteraceae bacterium]
MLKLYILFQATLLGLLAPHLQPPRHRERGSVTIEHVGWAVAVIAIVGIVVAAIKAYVTSQSGQLK